MFASLPSHSYRRGLAAVMHLITPFAVQAAGHETLKLDDPKPLLIRTPPMGWNS